jgi:predicted PurR-regulated permease PerM
MPPKKTAKKKPARKKGSGPKIDQHLVLENIGKYFLLISMLILLITILWIIAPFIPVLIISAVLATGFYPIHKRIRKYIKRRTPAAVVSMLIILLIIFVPVAWFVGYITDQAIDTYRLVESKVSVLLEIDYKLLPQIIEDSIIGDYVEQATDVLPIQPEDIISYVTTIVQNVSQFLVNQTTSFAKSLTVLAVHLFVGLLAIFFFLRDGDRATDEIQDLIPLAEKYRVILLEKLHLMSQGILYGIFGAAMAQGALGGIGFALAGIPNAAFWGTIMAFFSIVPYVGSTLIWAPAALMLFVTGHWVGGLFLVLWGMFVVGTIDNFIKPLIIGEKASIHPLLSFLAIIGGIFTMGLPGLIIAPYLLSLLLTFLYIYKLEYEGVLDQ